MNRSRRSPASDKSQQSRRSLRLETLEDRRLLAALPVQIADLELATQSSVGCANSAKLGDELYFLAGDGKLGEELWKTDGTESGTVLVKDINPGILSSVLASANTSNNGLVNVGGVLFFEADDGVHGRELWKSDGTSARTNLVIDLLPGPDSGNAFNIVERDGKVVFANPAGLWQSDGTILGTELIESFTSIASYSPYELTGVGDKVFFVMNSGSGVPGDTALWVTDGTAAGTQVVVDVNPNDGDGLDSFTAIGNTLYFTADDDVNGRELWMSDGTTVRILQVEW